MGEMEMEMGMEHNIPDNETLYVTGFHRFLQFEAQTVEKPNTERRQRYQSHEKHN
jgi:hypothetical protein